MYEFNKHINKSFKLALLSTTFFLIGTGIVLPNATGGVHSSTATVSIFALILSGITSALGLVFFYLGFYAIRTYKFFVAMVVNGVMLLLFTFLAVVFLLEFSIFFTRG